MFKHFLVSFAAVLASVAGFCQNSGDMPVIYIGPYSTTHVLFTTDLTYLDISMPEYVKFRVVEASKNMVSFKALKEFDFETTVSALEANGTMHTIKVCYDPHPEQLIVDLRPNASQNVGSTVNTQVRPDEKKPGVKPVSAITASNQGGASSFGKSDAPTIEEVMRKEQGIYHIGDRNFNVEAYCTNVFVYSNLTYIVLELHNNTDISFDTSNTQFSVENLKETSKTLSTDKPVEIKSSFGTLNCAPRKVTKMGFTVPKLTLLKNECLRIYIYEKSGNRNLVLTLSDKDVNYAVSPK